MKILITLLLSCLALSAQAGESFTDSSVYRCNIPSLSSAAEKKQLKINAEGFISPEYVLIRNTIGYNVANAKENYIRELISNETFEVFSDRFVFGNYQVSIRLPLRLNSVVCEQISGLRSFQ